MGGCRCSYGTCTIKSNMEPPAHMFHFPVFDKTRCHQWITNAKRLDFLDLKLSQLKNRVICEHHFKDSDFMNYTKGKLKNDAIPTLDGPYCKLKHEQKDSEMFLINLEDIENEHLTNFEKKAHFSVKYADFLTNDVTDLQSLNLTPTPKSQSNLHINRAYDGSYKSSLGSIYDNSTSYDNSVLPDPVLSKYQNNLPDPKILPIKYEELNINAKDIKKPAKLLTLPPKQIQIQSPISKKPIRNNKVKIISQKKISHPVQLKGELQTVSPTIILRVPDKKNNQHVEVNGTQIQTYFVNIQSELPTNKTQVLNSNNEPIQQMNTITGQGTNEFLPTVHDMPNLEENNLNTQNVEVVAKGTQQTAQLEPNHVSNINCITIMPDTRIAPMSNKLSKNMPDISMSKPDEHISTVTADTLNVPATPIEVENKSRSLVKTKESYIAEFATKDKQIIPRNTKNRQIIAPSTSPSSSSVSKSITKSKMPPEKIAVIEEKRKYNMKLRDIINSCLNKLDEDPNDKKSPTTVSKNLNDKKVGEHLSNHPGLPTTQENIVSYLEARLQRMEDILLNKIDKNTHQIVELKKTIGTKSGKKSVFTQTYTNLDTKKHLYHQISQYLTPEANNLVYEELFINKYAENILNGEPSIKKRKRR